MSELLAYFLMSSLNQILCYFAYLIHFLRNTNAFSISYIRLKNTLKNHAIMSNDDNISNEQNDTFDSKPKKLKTY